jgi:hypothetical protein
MRRKGGRIEEVGTRVVVRKNWEGLFVTRIFRPINLNFATLCDLLFSNPAPFFLISC